MTHIMSGSQGSNKEARVGGFVMRDQGVGAYVDQIWGRELRRCFLGREGESVVAMPVTHAPHA